jgi:hypothetical protein
MPPEPIFESETAELAASDDSGVHALPEPSLHLERRIDGRLWVVRAEGASAVEVVRCFPWTEPERFLSLRDAEGNELCFIADLGELDPGSRSALDASLARSGFVLEITRILAVEEDFELRSFRVETEQGPRRFQTALDAWPRRLDRGGLLLQDVHGDLYRLSTPAALDRASREHLRAFLD